MPASAESATVRWQQGARVFVRSASCEKSSSGAVRVTLGEKPAARQFLLEPDGMLVTRGWTGQVGTAPPDLAVWSAFLTIYQNSGRLPVGERELHTPGARIAVSKTAHRLQSVGIRSLDAPESLSVVFRPAR